MGEVCRAVGPRLAHGGAGQLRGHPLPTPAGHVPSDGGCRGGGRRRVPSWPRAGARRGPGPPGGGAAGGRDDLDRGPAGGRGGHGGAESEAGATLRGRGRGARAAAAEALARTPELLGGPGPGRRGRRRGHRATSCSFDACWASSTRRTSPSPRAPGRLGQPGPRGRSTGGGGPRPGRASPAWGTCATRSCTSSTPPTTRWRTSRRSGPASGTRSSWSAATGCGTATSTPTTSGRPSRPASTPAARATSG